MSAPRYTHILLSLTAGLGLSACSTVEFQTPPGVHSDCDPQLVGDWQLFDLQHADNDKDAQYLRVTAGCEHFYTLELGTDDAGKSAPDIDDIEDDMEIGFARTASRSFISARDRPKADAVATPEDKPDGYVLIAYEPADGSFTLRQIDLKATAHLIVDGAIPGWIDKRDRQRDGSRKSYGEDFWVYVFGDAEHTEQLLEQHDLLDSPWLRLTPVTAETSAMLDTWMTQAPDKTGTAAKGK
jgi:hypothetical protein